MSLEMLLFSRFCSATCRYLSFRGKKLVRVDFSKVDLLRKLVITEWGL